MMAKECVALLYHFSKECQMGPKSLFITTAYISPYRGGTTAWIKEQIARILIDHGFLLDEVNPWVFFGFLKLTLLAR